MPILVTGATGFIGRALVRRLVDHGKRVRCALRRPIAVRGAETVVVGEIGPQTLWQEAVSGASVVVHLAGVRHLPARSQSAGVYRAVNAGGTDSLVRAAVAAGVKRLVLVSSIGVNGDTSGERPFREEDAANPHGPYAASKLEAEQRLVEIAGGQAIEWCIVRPPMVYGPNAHGNFRQLLGFVARGWPLPLGSATAKRSYIALDNLISVLLRTVDDPAAGNTLFLASDGEDVSAVDFIHCLGKHMRTKVRLVPVPPILVKAAAAVAGRPLAASRLFAPLQIDVSRLRSRLAWRPEVTLDEGMRRVAEDLRSKSFS
jgi:nucleoside-diphosphate-sugar epimerase